MTAPNRVLSARMVTIPAAALHALRDALLGTPDGAARLRDAGYVAGVALYADFAAEVREEHGTEPDALALPTFAAALGAYLDSCGWGTARVGARQDDAVLRLTSGDWVEADGVHGEAFASCHYSTGMLAGFFGRAAREPLAVLELGCRGAGAPGCEFAIGSRGVLDRLWEEMGAG